MSNNPPPAMIPGGKPCGCGNPTCPQCFPNGIPTNFPGLTPGSGGVPNLPQQEKPFPPEKHAELDALSTGCFEQCHPPLRVKVVGSKKLWYICDDCIKAYLAKPENKDVKDKVVGIDVHALQNPWER